MPPVTNKVTGPGEAAFVGESEQFNGLLGYSTADGHAGVCGVSDSGNSNGIVGRSKQANGVLGYSASTGHAGVAGANDDGDGQGVYGRSAKSDGVLGISASTGHAGVSGVNNDGDGPGVYGHSTKNGGVVGNSSSAAHAGVAGTNDNAVGVGVFGKGGRLAGLFEGQVEITGGLNVTGEVKQGGTSLLALIATLQQQVAALAARVMTLEAATADSGTPTISATGVSGARRVKIEGAHFKKGVQYRIRVGVGSPLNERDFNGSTSAQGAFSLEIPTNEIPVGTALWISATDGTPSHSDLTGVLWSNTVQLTSP